MKRTAAIALVLIAAAAVALRWIGLSRESLWFDEGMSWWLASLSPRELIRVISNDVAAPLHYLLLHGWQVLFGDTDVAMRALSALAATLTLVPFYFLARRSLKTDTGLLIACGLMAVSFMQIQYAKEARYYALLSLFAVTALACVPELAGRRCRMRMGVIAVCAVAGLYTHNMMMFCLAGLYGAWLLWPGPRPLRRRIGDMAIVGVIVLLAYLPWVPILLQQMRWMTGSFWAKRPDAFMLTTALAAVTGVDVWAVGGPVWRVIRLLLPPMLYGGVASLCLIIAAGISCSRTAAALVAFALGPVTLVFVYSLIRQPVFMERVFIAGSAVTPILLAMAVERRRRVGGAIVGIVAVLGVITVSVLLTDRRKEDWRGAYQTVAQLPPSDSRLILFVANEGEMPFAYYAAHDSRVAEARTGAPQGFLELDPPQTIRRVMGDADLTLLRQRMGDPKWEEIVLVLSHDDFSDPGGLTERELKAKWRLVGETPLRLVRVLRFRR